MPKCRKGFKVKNGKCVSSGTNKIMNFIPRKFPPIMVYILGAFLEVIGFGLIFAFDKTMEIIHKVPILFALLIIFSGYVIAVGARKK